MNRDSYLRNKYGITQADYIKLLAKQKGACAICNKPPKQGKNLNVDHDHRTKAIRGLLCAYCNRYQVGRWRKEDIPRLRRIIAYLNAS